MITRYSRLLAFGALLATAGCASLGGAPTEEVVELLSMGRERPLRSPMRPIRGETRVILFALDGVGAEQIESAIATGAMPRTAALLGGPGGGGLYPRAYAAPAVATVLPSATLPAWTAILTGQPPGRNGIPGNEFFVREETAFYAPVPVTIRDREHAVQLYTDELLSPLVETPTLFEGIDLRAHVSTAQLFRGADLLTVPNLASFGDLFEATVRGAAGGGVSSDGRVHREADERSVRDLVQALDDHGVPDLQVVYLPGTDLYTHVADDPLASQRAYLTEVTDPLIGAVLDAYAERGALDDTWIVLTSDHGHTEVLPDDRHSLGVEGEDEPPAVLRRLGFRVRPFTLSPGADEQDFQAVLASQGGMAFVYLADRSTCAVPGERCDWTRAPRLEEDVLPVARAFHAASARGEGVPELRGSLELVLARPPRAPGEEALPFQAFDGERLVPLGEYLRDHPHPDLLRLEERLAELATGPFGHRAGDVLLLARLDATRPVEERFYFAEPQHSEHGSPHAQDSLVPVIVAHPGRSGAEVRRVVRDAMGETADQLDLATLVRTLLRGR